MASGKDSAVRGKRAEPRAGATLPYYKPRPLFFCAVTGSGGASVPGGRGLAGAVGVACVFLLRSFLSEVKTKTALIFTLSHL